MARALVTEPEILLLNGSLSNLDVSLREEMRFEILWLHETFAIATQLNEAANEAFQGRILETVNYNDSVPARRGIPRHQPAKRPTTAAAI